MTPDPTTRDPAASQVACHRTITGNGSAWSWMDGPASLGALDNLRANPGWRIENAYVVDAPALLAEVARLRHDAAERDAFDARHVAMTMTEYTEFKLAKEAAEQVAREACALIAEILGPAGGDFCMAGELESRAGAFLLAQHYAHHGARTGESNEA